MQVRSYLQRRSSHRILKWSDVLLPAPIINFAVPLMTPVRVHFVRRSGGLEVWEPGKLGMMDIMIGI